MSARLAIEQEAGIRVIMIRPDMRDIPRAAFPAGYGIRPMTMGDVGLWTDIQRDAEPFLKIKGELFHQEFGMDPEGVTRRCFIMTDPKDLGVGTISAWYNRDFHGADYGRIHWVAVRPRCQGIGLGKAALAFAMDRLAEWHERSYLVTSTGRVGAIALYLAFGFEPDMSEPDARTAWGGLGGRLGHPAIGRALAGGRKPA